MNPYLEDAEGGGIELMPGRIGSFCKHTGMQQRRWSEGLSAPNPSASRFYGNRDLRVDYLKGYGRVDLWGVPKELVGLRQVQSFGLSDSLRPVLYVQLADDAMDMNLYVARADE